MATSVGIVIASRTPNEAAALVADARDALPPRVRQEFLVLDDHTNPQRRELVSALEGCGDAMRLVPRPSGGAAVELDALAISCGSEFLLLSFGDSPPLDSVEPLMEAMWSHGSDAGVVLESEEPLGTAGDDAASRFVACAGLAGAGGKLGGVDGGPLGTRVLLVRRWVARWVFSETDRALDASVEVAERARLLGLEMVAVDAAGVPLG